MKETNQVEFKNDVNQLSKIKDWFNSQKVTQPYDLARDYENYTPIGNPQWDSVRIYTYQLTQTTDYVIPMRFEEENLKVNQFIVLKLDDDGDVIQGEYVYLFLDSTATNNYTKKELEILPPSTFDFINIPNDLSAWIMKYDLNFKLISTKYLSNGNAEDNDLKFGTFVYNKAPLQDCESPVTVDWYYQIWVNGELLYEEYLYSTNECEFGGGGGGGGFPIDGTEVEVEKEWSMKETYFEVVATYTFKGIKFNNTANNIFCSVAPSAGKEVPDFYLIGVAGSPTHAHHATWRPLSNKGKVSADGKTATTIVLGDIDYTLASKPNFLLNRPKLWVAKTEL